MHEHLARLHNADLDRELAHLAATRMPMHDRPGPRRTGRRRLGRWLALAGARLGTMPTDIPAGASVARVTIRPACETDDGAIALLAELDERSVPKGYVLLAELDEDVIAALPLHGKHALTDPRRATVDVVELLELRSRQLRLGRWPVPA